MREKFRPTSKQRESVDIELPYEFEDIAMCVKHSPYHEDKDLIIFNRYFNKKITIDECLNLFKINNNITLNINRDKFKKWLASLGYGN